MTTRRRPTPTPDQCAEQVAEYRDYFESLSRDVEAADLGYLADCVLENTVDLLGPEPTDPYLVESVAWWQSACASLWSEGDANGVTFR